MTLNKKLTIVISLIALILFSGCNIDVEELGDKLCKDLGYNSLTDSKNEFNPRPVIMGTRNQILIYEKENKYYMETNLILECDNNYIIRNINYYDPKYQNPIYNGNGWSYTGIPYQLGRSCNTTCISKDKWGYCDDWKKSCKQGEAKLDK